MASSPDLDALVEGFAAAVAEAVKAQVEQALIEVLTGQVPARAPTQRAPAKRAATKRATTERATAKRTRAATVTRPQRRQPRASVPASPRKRRTSAELERSQVDIAAFVKREPGCRAEAIGAALKLSSKELGPVLRAMVESGTLRKEGVARGTRYFFGPAPSNAGTSTPAAKQPQRAKRDPQRRAAKSASKARRGAQPQASTEQPAANDNADRSVRTRLRTPRRDAGNSSEGAMAPATSEASEVQRDLRAQTLQWVQNNPGDTTAIISQALEAGSPELRGVLQALVSEGAIVREGEGQGATYFAPQ